MTIPCPPPPPPMEAYYPSSAYFQGDILISQICPWKLFAKFVGFSDKSEFSSWHAIRNTSQLTCPGMSKVCCLLLQSWAKPDFKFSINNVSNFDTVSVFWPSDCSDKYQKSVNEDTRVRFTSKYKWN